jgi:hypothetical protein
MQNRQRQQSAQKGHIRTAPAALRDGGKMLDMVAS